MKQTATEWLFEWMGNNQYFIGNDLLKAFKQAKEMEKQQIIDTHGSKLISPKGLASEYWMNGEDYYNKTFNKGQKESN